MNRVKVISELRRNREVFADLLLPPSEEMTLYRPAENKWNLLEIVCHLFDEERLDFRARMRHIIEGTGDKMPPIDPEGWVKIHRYSERDYKSIAEDFLNERGISLEWLETITDDDLSRSFDHAVFGNVSAGFFLYNWLAHDYLHIRQITSLKFSYLREFGNQELKYAGDW